MMAQLQAITLKTEVSGNMINTLLKAVPNYTSKLLGIFSENNIEHPNSEKWYALQDILNIYKEISRQFGPHVLFTIGKHLSRNNPLSQDYSNLEEALSNLDNMHRYHHRGGEIGSYKLLNYSPERKEAKVECRNPYPCYLDRGILTNLAVKFKPSEASLILVELDRNRPNRLAGGDVSYYNVLWI